MELVTLVNLVGDTSGDIVRAVVFDCRGKGKYLLVMMMMKKIIREVDMGVAQPPVSGCVSPIWSEPPPLVGLLPRTPNLKPHCFISPFANPAAI